MDRVGAVSIVHISEGVNYRINHYGLPSNITSKFEDYCTYTDAIWGHLFNEQTGACIATYSSEDGLTTVKG